MDLLRALLFLRYHSVRNMLGARLCRLRQPKYLLGAIAGVAYFWFFFFRPTTGGAGAGNPVQALNLAFGEGRAEILAAAILSLFVLMIWLVPGNNPGLAFNEAEVAFLFPAPLTRRQLIHYKLLDGLLVSLFGALFFTLLSAGVRQGWSGALRHLGAWWSLNANLALHQTAAALTISRLAQFGFDAAGRRIFLIVAAVIAVIGVLVFWADSNLSSLSWLLWPARLAIGPFLAPTFGSYLLALVPAFGLVAIHYFWVHRLETPFEEASLARAQKAGQTLARLRAGGGVRLGTGPLASRRAPFALARWMPPEAALLWKNLMAAPALFDRRLFLGAAFVLTAGLIWLKRQTGFPGMHFATAIGFISLALMLYVLVIGPQLARNDLRGDLPHLDLLKVYPLPGWRIVLGSLLAPTVLLTAVAWLLLLTGLVGITAPPRLAGWFTPSFRLAAGIAIGGVMPALCAVQLLVPNAATLVFPAWAQPARPAAGGGIDVLGQRLIFFGGQIICLLFALAPAVLAGGFTIFVTQWLVGPAVAVLLAAIPVLLIFVVEVWLGVAWLGPRFERLDISAELRP